MTEYLQKSFDMAFSNGLQSLHLGATLYVLTILLSSIWYVARVRAWPSAEGHLLRDQPRSLTTLQHGADREELASYARYRYSVNGSSYEGVQVSLWKGATFWATQSAIRHLPRQAQQTSTGNILVYFNPNRPERSLIVRPGWGSIAVLWSLSILTVGYYVWRW